VLTPNRRQCLIDRPNNLHVRPVGVEAHLVGRQRPAWHLHFQQEQSAPEGDQQVWRAIAKRGETEHARAGRTQRLDDGDVIAVDTCGAAVQASSAWARCA